MDYVFTVQTGNKYLLYSPLHNMSALINRCAVKSLKDGIFKDRNLYELHRSISKKPSIPAPYKGPVDPDFTGLIPTRACNFKCLYCGFGSGKDMSTMDFSTAVSSVEWMVEHAIKKGRSDVEIHFFGGEPFFAPDVIRVAVYRTGLLCARYNLRPVFKVTTNGFFDEEICTFIGDYFHTVVLSLDGPGEIQNRYRPLKNGGKTSHTVERNAFLLGISPAELCIRLCVTEETVEQLEDITHWICNSFNPFSIDFEVLRSTSEAEETGLLPPSPWRFSVNYIKASSAARKYGVTPVYGPASTDTLQHTFCPVGKDSIIVSPDGTISACYLQEEEWKKKGLDLNFGKIISGKMDIDENNLEKIRRLTDEKEICKKCIARFHCAGGCHVNNALSPGKYGDFCIQTRIITLCNLLYELGAIEDMETLINHRKHMETVALASSHLLSDWNENHDTLHT